ncbi:MAG: M15 family metallopeptidase [Bacteroidia bacterium]|nr:M15 family metallopeptidase [Bacteroidia bacterium]
MLLLACENGHQKYIREINELKAEIDQLKSKDSIRKLPIKTEIPKDTSYLESVFKNYDLVNIHELDSTIEVDLRYADTNNFMKRNMYDGLRNAYFNCEMAIRIHNAQQFLKEKNKNYTLVILDAARPLHVQQIMWDSVRLDTAIRHSYLARPEQTSLHNYGCAVDITIKDLSTGKFLDMGTDFDTFSKLAQPAYEWVFLGDGKLSKPAGENRKLLRETMRRARMNSISSEWWHFSMCTKEEAVLKYKLIK